MEAGRENKQKNAGRRTKIQGTKFVSDFLLEEALRYVFQGPPNGRVLPTFCNH